VVADMRLVRYLTEETTQEIADTLLKDCSKYIREMKQERRMLWRGSWKRISDIEKFKSHTSEGRRPKDMTIWVHHYLNELFVKKIGWPVRDGVFCYNSAHTDVYGPTMWMFPIGDYKYCWTPDLEDLFFEFSSFKAEHIMNNIKDRLDQNPKSIKNDSIREWAKSVVEYKKYYNKHFGKAGIKNEISVWCDDYYLVSPQIQARDDGEIIANILRSTS
jgi:hypothetical protein